VTLATAIGATARAEAQTGAALVLSTSGTTTPVLQPFTEIAPGTTVSLAPDARLMMMHYGACRLVSVIGGEVRIDREDYKIVAGTVEREEPRPCPQRVQARGQVAGAFLRGKPVVPTVAARPHWVLVGPMSGEVTAVRVLQDGQLIQEIGLEDRQAVWPRAAPALTPGVDYELALVLRTPGTAPGTTKFRVSGAPETGASAPTVLTIE